MKPHQQSQKNTGGDIMTDRFYDSEKINSYGKLTVEIIEDFINQEIDHYRNELEEDLRTVESDRKYHPEAANSHHVHLLHESTIKLDTLIDFKRRLKNHDLNIRCRDGE